MNITICTHLFLKMSICTWLRSFFLSSRSLTSSAKELYALHVRTREKSYYTSCVWKLGWKREMLSIVWWVRYLVYHYNILSTVVPTWTTCKTMTALAGKCAAWSIFTNTLACIIQQQIQMDSIASFHYGNWRALHHHAACWLLHMIFLARFSTLKHVMVKGSGTGQARSQDSSTKAMQKQRAASLDHLGLFQSN